MNNLKLGDNTENYIMLSAFSFTTLKALGIEQSVIERLKDKPFVNLKNEVFELGEVSTLDDLSLITDLYVGTIFNNSYSENEVIENIFEMELPDSFIHFSLQFNLYRPILKWKEYYFSAYVSKFNQLIIHCIGKIKPDYEENCFNLTTKMES